MPITLDGTNGITTPTYGGADTSEYLVPVTQFKNRLLNSDMRIDQRNAGASVTINNTGAFQYVVDRFYGFGSTASKFTLQQNAGSVTRPTGFTDYLGATSLSAYSITSSDIMVLGQEIEGYNIADLGWGTANAKTVTLSFWVRSSLTGTFGGAISNSAQDRSYPYSYTISSANTWEYKTVTITGDTSGSWLTLNGVGLRVRFSLGSGSTFSGTAGAWANGNLFSATGATSVVGTNGATFYITGVQLEVGSTATSFDYRPYGTELALCQRYCYVYQPNRQIGQAIATNNALVYAPFPVTMRGAPTATYATASTYQLFDASASPVTVTSISLFSATVDGALHRPFVASGIVAGNATLFGGSSKTILSAEL